MAGLDDYQYFSKFRERESPFWEKSTSERDMERCSEIGNMRPKEFPQKLHASHSLDKSLPVSQNISSSKATSDAVENAEKYGELSINIINLCAENLMGHPFIVLRRQCQVNGSSHRYHLLPITVVPAIIHLQACQGFSVFWKGLGSVLIIKGVTMALEDFISKFTPWPKEVSPHSSPKMLGQHLLLKCMALVIITPFYSASLVETVQSEIASEKPGVLDVFREGLMRLLSFAQTQTSQMLPVWCLVIPTVAHGILQYILVNAISMLSLQALRYHQRQAQLKQGASNKDSSLQDTLVRLHATFIGQLSTAIILYPVETILHRLHLQGTRTIIDSLDASYEVKPILTRYEGFFDCLSTVIREEGALGLFKGFGALCLQYAVYGAVLKFSNLVIREVTQLFAPYKPKVQPKDGDPANVPSPAVVDSETEDTMNPLAPTPSYPSTSSLHHRSGSSFHDSPHRVFHVPSERTLTELEDLLNTEKLAQGQREQFDFDYELQKHRERLNIE